MDSRYALSRIPEELRSLRRRLWRMPPQRVVLLLLLLAVVFMRLPYFFMASDIRLWRYEMLYHDEALFLMQGRDVLNGRLPYIGHWDNRPPLGWALFAVFNLLSGENLVAFRALGALYMGITAFVLYRTLAGRQKAPAGLVAAFCYIVFGSVAQVSQSVTYELVAALPFSLMMYLLLNPRDSRHHRLQIALLFAVCVMTLTNFIFLGPALALLMPPRPGTQDRAVPPAFAASGAWRRDLLRWGAFVLRNGLMLLVTVILCYAVIYIVYWIQDQHDFLLRSLIDGAFVVSRQPMDERLVTQFLSRWKGFSLRFLNSYVYSNEWLIPFMLLVFLCGTAATLFARRGQRDTVLIQITMLMLCGALALFLRGGNFWNFPYYLLQMMPLVALGMGCAIALRMGDARLVMLLVIFTGLHDATRLVLSQYRPLIAHARGTRAATDTQAFLNDRLYRIAQVINTFPVAGQNMIVCNEDNMLYILTHTVNPRYFIFSAFAGNPYLTRVLGVTVKPLATVVQESKPVAVTGWHGDASCLSTISRELKADYELHATIHNTVVYIRKDLLMRPPGIAPATPPPAPSSYSPSARRP